MEIAQGGLNDLRRSLTDGCLRARELKVAYLWSRWKPEMKLPLLSCRSTGFGRVFQRPWLQPARQTNQVDPHCRNYPCNDNSFKCLAALSHRGRECSTGASTGATLHSLRTQRLGPENAVHPCLHYGHGKTGPYCCQSCNILAYDFASGCPAPVV